MARSTFKPIAAAARSQEHIIRMLNNISPNPGDIPVLVSDELYYLFSHISSSCVFALEDILVNVIKDK